MTTATWATSPSWSAAGWTMLHYAWIGALLGIAAALGRRLLQNASPDARYAYALACLGTLAVAPAGIAWDLAARGEVEGPRPIEPTTFQGPATTTPRGAEPLVAASRPPVTPRAVTPPTLPPPSLPRRGRGEAVAAALPWVWLVGAPLTFAYLATGLVGAERLRRQSRPVRDGDLTAVCAALAHSLGVARRVAVAVCDRVAAPVLLGVIRPLILLPAAALSGWSAELVEMALLHELAHVRRRDNLVNLLQRLIEAALFFQPAVWVISGWVRQEREHCCDRVVVAHTGRALAYAETLLALSSPAPPLAPRPAAMAMARSHLVVRIRHILNPEDHAMTMKLPRAVVALGATLLLTPALWVAAHAQQGRRAGEADRPRAGAAKDEPKPDEGRSVKDWIAAMSDPDAAVRLKAARALGEIESDDADAAHRIEVLLNTAASRDRDPAVRREAATAIDRRKVPAEREHRRKVERRRVDPVRGEGKADPVDPPDAAEVKEPGGPRVLRLRGDTAGAEDAAFSPDGRLLATAHTYTTNPGEVKLWDFATGAEAFVLPGRKLGAAALAFSPDGKTLAVAESPLGEVRPPAEVVLWDLIARTPRATLTGHATRIATVAFSPDGKLIASGGEDATVRLYEAATGRPAGPVIRAGKGWVRSLAFSPDGETLALGVGLAVKLWDLAAGAERAVLSPSSGRFWVLSVAFTPDGRRVAAAGAILDDRDVDREAAVRVYDVAGGDRLASLSFGGGIDQGLRLASGVAYAPDGSRLAAVAMGTIRLWDGATYEERRTIAGGPGGSESTLTFSRDGRWLAVTGGRPGAVVHDMKTGAMSRQGAR